jgi:hypothetical protein
LQRNYFGWKNAMTTNITSAACPESLSWAINVVSRKVCEVWNTRRKKFQKFLLPELEVKLLIKMCTCYVLLLLGYDAVYFGINVSIMAQKLSILAMKAER